MRTHRRYLARASWLALATLTSIVAGTACLSDAFADEPGTAFARRRGVLGDVDGDGRGDLALTGGFVPGTTSAWWTVPTAFSNGDGTFRVANGVSRDFALYAAQPGAIAVSGDFNGDGRSDLALTGGTGWNTIPVALSNGDGTFRVTNLPSSFFAACAQQRAQAITGDFNADGRSDIALTGGAGWMSVPVAFSNGDGTFNVTNHSVADFPRFATDAGAHAVTADFNGDGKTDLALTGGKAWRSIPVAFSNGDGTFRVTNLGNGSFAAMAAQATQFVAGDVDGDGRGDIALAGGQGWASIPVAFSAGDGSFSVTNASVVDFPGFATQTNPQLVASDFDGDGKTDLALTGGTGWASIPVAFSTGHGSFRVTNRAVPSFPVLATQGATGGDAPTALSGSQSRNIRTLNAFAVAPTAFAGAPTSFVRSGTLVPGTAAYEIELESIFVDRARGTVRDGDDYDFFFLFRSYKALLAAAVVDPTLPGDQAVRVQPEMFGPAVFADGVGDNLGFRNDGPDGRPRFRVGLLPVPPQSNDMLRISLTMANDTGLWLSRRGDPSEEVEAREMRKGVDAATWATGVYGGILAVAGVATPWLGATVAITLFVAAVFVDVFDPDPQWYTCDGPVIDRAFQFSGKELAELTDNAAREHRIDSFDWFNVAAPCDLDQHRASTRFRLVIRRVDVPYPDFASGGPPQCTYTPVVWASPAAWQGNWGDTGNRGNDTVLASVWPDGVTDDGRSVFDAWTLERGNGTMCLKDIEDNEPQAFADLLPIDPPYTVGRRATGTCDAFAGFDSASAPTTPSVPPPSDSASAFDAVSSRLGMSISVSPAITLHMYRLSCNGTSYGYRVRYLRKNPSGGVESDVMLRPSVFVH